MAMEMLVNWVTKPFPHAIIDNFLTDDEFSSLCEELDNKSLSVQSRFTTSVEKKTIFLDSDMGEKARALVRVMGGDNIKQVFSKECGAKIQSMGDTIGYSGYSPYHITEDGGYLGAHVDHSEVNNGALRHIGNTIFYASKTWEEGWGGETILYSKNGFSSRVEIKPIPNRLIIFLHTAHSFHGVNTYDSKGESLRRTFYHDYYTEAKDIDKTIQHINKKHNINTIHSFHDTTFVPPLPLLGANGGHKISILAKKQTYTYLLIYLIYKINKRLGSKFTLKSLMQILNR